MKTILVVDDELDIIETVQSILDEEGYHTAICSNGAECLEYLRHHSPPDLIILDIMMPFVSGYQVLESMRENTQQKSIPIILTSAVYPTVKQSEYGWRTFLKKPFTLDALLATVSEIIGSPSGKKNRHQMTA